MGYRIKELRIEKKMSQEELAEKSNVSRTTISTLESGSDRTVLTSTLQRIAAALDTTVDKLFFTPDV